MRKKRYYLVQLILLFSISTNIFGQLTVEPPVNWTRIDRTLNWSTPTIIHEGPPFVRPRGVIMDSLKTALYIGDPGSHTEPAKIIRMPVAGDSLGEPVTFYSDTSVLKAAKWPYPTFFENQEYLLIADQGEIDIEGNFTGVGAKIFRIPVLENGFAGSPEVIWSGPPLKCPTGIVRIGNYAIVTDPCSGPLITRPDAPNSSFPASNLFSIRLDGTEAPQILHQGAPFTSMIGICLFVPGTVLINDTDAGRLDPTSTGGRPGFAPPGGAEKFVLDILNSSSSPPTLENLRRQPIFEEGPLKFHFTGLQPSSQIKVEMLGDNCIVDRRNEFPPEKMKVFAMSDLDDNQDLTFNIASSTMLDSVSLTIVVDQIQWDFCLPKDTTQSTQSIDNKHAGAKPRQPVASVFNRITVDQSSSSIWVYPDEGGTPVKIAQGGIISEPLSGQLSPSNKKFWVVDKGNSSLYEIAFPADSIFEQIFPFRGMFDLCSPSVPVGIESFQTESLMKIYPNPIESTLKISFEDTSIQDWEIRIFDINGRRVFAESYQKSILDMEIDVSYFRSGAYIVEIRNAQKYFQQIIIKL